MAPVCMAGAPHQVIKFVSDQVSSGSSCRANLEWLAVLDELTSWVVGDWEVIAELSFLEDEIISAVLQRFARGPETGY
jgi:hypothetical protein